ncbi:MAG TPA: hypothetical protein VHK87_17845 [Phenylobacterium sp.]|jgi:hypothetical protein|nr:hypothetical protein [Phenylobacterium sp.]
MHRLLIAAVVLAAAPPVAAQGLYDPNWIARDAELRAQQEMMRNRSIDLQNQITTLEMRLQAERSLRDLEVQARRPTLMAPPERRTPARPGGAELGGFTSIPDDRLSASNDRVRAASRPAR